SIHPETVVSPGALDAPPGVMCLSQDHVPSDPAAGAGIVSGPVLGPTKQYIPRGLSRYPGEKPPPGRTECQRHIPPGTGPHERRRRTGIGERDDAVENVEGIAGDLLLATISHHVLPIQGQVNVLT